MFQTHLCRVCDHLLSLFLYRSFLSHLFSLYISRSLLFPPFSALSISFSLSLSRSFSTIIRSRSLSFSVYLHFTPFAHTFIPNRRTLTVPNRIDLTLSVADYKSDQLGARCACRIRIGERSMGANVGA